MLILYVALFVPALSLAVSADRPSKTASFVKPKRGTVENDHDAPRDYKFHQSKPSQNDSPKFLSYSKDAKGVQRESSINGQPNSHPNDQLSPYFGNLFTMTAGYKVANDAVPVKQASHQSTGVHGVSNLQVPVYKTNYPLSKASGSQIYMPPFQSNLYSKKTPLPILYAQNGQQIPTNFANVQSQPLILHPVDQFNFPARTPKVNNAQLSAPFLSPLSSFHSQVIPISTSSNNPQFPQYKGAAIEIYPTVGGFSPANYAPLQTQQQLHFGQGNVQHVGGHRNLSPAQEIRTDVEIINKKKPSLPPPKTDDDEDEDDEGYTPPDREYAPNAHDDDYESKPEKHFKAPRTEGDFKPSTYFPFKEYDEKFGKYSSQNHDEEAEEKPFPKYRDYSSSSDDDDGDDTPSAKYHSKETSSKPYYSRDEEEEEEEDGQGYESQKTEDTSDDTYRSKYIDKNVDVEYEASPKQRYAHAKEVPEVVYGSKYSSRNKDAYESDSDATSQGSRTSFNYHEFPQVFNDHEGQSSHISVQMAHEGGFGYKLPKKIRSNRAKIFA
ncbi:uncharacterized protein LOC122396954 [Colletes gigas]|uniref:uncharacterized protein LOC122396954 n=1 Tax=Colletes gigas TaxID=935657 RepID=UPI001C9BA1F5|nr:uncharacterized protein LOC122396954 [Colletes gigas]